MALYCCRILLCLGTVLDAWNGYHSVPLAEEDRSKTAFLTPWGRYRYVTAPQGFLAAGDGCTARYNAIFLEIAEVKKCVDDAILWAGDMEEIFDKTCSYISHCAEAGITFNPEKFVFGQKDVKFLGFHLAEVGVKPSKKYLESIEGFPEPKDLPGIRSWFGLIQQVKYAYSDSSIMLPYRHLLKTGSSYQWTEELGKLFQESKKMVIEAVENGVKTLDMSRPTCLSTDWSRLGLGVGLMQKVCSCIDLHPLCCKEGWQITFAGSRFTTPAE